MAKRGVVGNRLDFIEPMQPTLVDEPPEGEDWLHELKLDGYRSQIVLEAGKARVFTRRGHDWTGKYWPIAQAAEALACRSAIIDGEMIVLDEIGRVFFRELRSAIMRAPTRAGVRRLRSPALTARISATGRFLNGARRRSGSSPLRYTKGEETLRQCQRRGVAGR